MRDDDRVHAHGRGRVHCHGGVHGHGDDHGHHDDANADPALFPLLLVGVGFEALE